MAESTLNSSNHSIEKSPSMVHSAAFHKLRSTALAVCAVIRLQKNKATTVDDYEELILSVENSPRLPKSEQQRHSLTLQAIDNHKKTEVLFAHIRRGSRSDMLKIENLIQDSPLNYLRSPNDPDNFVNKPNPMGCRPIHEAVRNGHLGLVQMFIDYGADPTLLSQVSKTEWESTLTTSCRWNYIDIVKLLLKSTQWTTPEIVRAKRATANTAIRDLLKAYDPKAFSWWKCF